MDAPVSFSADKTHLQVQVRSLKGAEGNASPSSFDLSDGGDQSVNISYQAPIVEKGSASISASVQDGLPSTKPSYTIKNRKGTVVSQGSLNWGQPTVVRDLDAPGGKATYTLNTPDFIDNQTEYVPNGGDARSIIIQKNKTTNVSVSYHGKPIVHKPETVVVTLSGLPDKQTAVVTLKNAKTGHSDVINASHNGKYQRTIIQDHTDWSVVASDIDKKKATIAPDSFVAQKDTQPVTVNYANSPGSDKLFAGYIDVSATQTAQAVLGKTSAENLAHLKKIKADGYNTLIYAFANIQGVNMVLHNAEDQQFYNAISAAHQLGFRVLVSVGGDASANTFNPNNADVNALAGHIVNFLKQEHLDGIDFDIEVSVDPDYFDRLLKAIRQRGSQLFITAAPQLNLNGSSLIYTSNGTAPTYKKAIANGDFNALFVQEYNTGGFKINDQGVAGLSYQCAKPAPQCADETDIAFIGNSLLAMKKITPQQTKIVVGEPTEDLSAFSTTIYRSNHQESSLAQIAPLINKQIQSISSDQQFGGIMGWSMNIDYDPTVYGPVKSDHVAGSFAGLLSKCVLKGEC